MVGDDVHDYRLDLDGWVTMFMIHEFRLDWDGWVMMIMITA